MLSAANGIDPIVTIMTNVIALTLRATLEIAVS